MPQDIYYLLGGAGALLGGISAWRTRGLSAERAGWERIYRAMATENKDLRRECRLLRLALRKALQRIKEAV